MSKINLSSVLYFERPQAKYKCSDCSFFRKKTSSCVLLNLNDTITEDGTCSFYIYGEAIDVLPLNLLTKKESNYSEHEEEIRCKTCKYFNQTQKICLIMSEEDSKTVSENGCCNLWTSYKEKSIIRTAPGNISNTLEKNIQTNKLNSTPSIKDNITKNNSNRVTIDLFKKKPGG